MDEKKRVTIMIRLKLNIKWKNLAKFSQLIYNKSK